MGITRRNNLRFICRPNDVVVVVVFDALLETLLAAALTTGDQAVSAAEAEAEAARLQACTD